MTRSGLVQAKRKDWHKWQTDNQIVSGYLLIVNERYFVYDRANIDPYGTITIKEYVEIDPSTIGAKV